MVRRTKDRPEKVALDSESANQIIEIEPNPSAHEEAADFDDPARQMARLHAMDLEGDINEKASFAWHAYRLVWTWLGFLIVMTWLQAVPDWFNFHLDEWAFRILSTSVTAAVFGFAYLIGKYLFPAGGRKRD